MTFRKALAGTVALVALTIQAPAFAQQIDFDVRSASATSVIPEFARQAGIQIVAPADDLSGIVLPQLKGNYDVREALRLLIRNSNLEISSDEGGIVQLRLTQKRAEVGGMMRVAADAEQTPQIAQSAPPSQEAAESLEEVIVTGSRIARAGYEAPTPVTMTNADELREAAAPTIGDFLQTLPSFGTSTNSRNPAQGFAGGTSGISLANLRQLGVNRTLVLFDGRRVVNAVLTGGVDLGMIPDSLVQRVDTVTGGASAAWGSDAVAGVVNVIVNKEFQGIEARVEGSISDAGDSFTHKEDISFGTSFADGKGHVIASFTYVNTPYRTLLVDRDWMSYPAVMPNPARTATNGEPLYKVLFNYGIANGTRGGLITSGPLKNTQFIGPNGTPAPYRVDYTAGPVVIGDDGARDIVDNRASMEPTKNYNFYSRSSYAFTDNISADVELNFAQVKSQFQTQSYPRNGTSITIKADNAYLPASIRTAMAANGITTFTLGVNNANYGFATMDSDRKLWRGVFGLNGRMFDDWSWNAYYQHGEVRNSSHPRNNPIVARYNQAIDAVVNPANGQIVCRSTLTNPTNGCVPMSLFGDGVVSPQAKNWIDNPRARQVIYTQQDVAAASVSGSPLSLWAGPVDIASGFEYRREGARADSDALSQARAYFAGNYDRVPPVAVKVKEGFLETNIPLAKDQAWARSLDFNAAARVTDYSTSGTVVTWKAGLAYQATDEIRLRLTRSRDIRAPTLNELYTPSQLVTTEYADPFKNAVVTAFSNSAGNQNLGPEIGNTWTGGIVYAPTWLEGFQTSVDAYRIKVTDSIFRPTANNVLNQCFAGNANYCALIQRDAAGNLFQINQLPVNIAEATVKGLDFEAGYRTTIGPGEANFRVLGAYIFELSQLADGLYVNTIGSVGSDTPNNTSGVPKLKLTANARYSLDAYSLTLGARLIGGAKLNTYWTTATLSEADNRVKPQVYVNLRSAYDFNAYGAASQVYISIDNLLDKDPPIVPQLYTTMSQNATGRNFGLYDNIGRYYHVGIRTKF